MRSTMIRASHPFHADPRFLLEPFEPAYLALHRAGALAERVTAGLRELEDCCACPRNCHVNRMENQTRVCHTGRYARVASAFAHFGEEDCLRGWNGSGTIFFSLCNLRCVFCQNWDISQQSAGSECPPEKLAELMLDLQHHGCHNINFVTPEHVVPQVLEAIAAAIPRGLQLPIVYNTSAIRLSRFLAIARRDRRHLHARLQVLGEGDGKAAGQGERLPGPGTRGDSGDAPAGRCAEIRTRRTGATRSAGPAPGDAGTVSRDGSRFAAGWPRKSLATPTSTSWGSTGRRTKWGRLPRTEPQPSTPRSTGGREATRSPGPTRQHVAWGCGASTSAGRDDTALKTASLSTCCLCWM